MDVRCFAKTLHGKSDYEGRRVQKHHPKRFSRISQKY